MLDFLGVTEHFSCIENTPFSFPALFRDMAGEAVSVDGVIFSGSIVSANKEVLKISIEKGEASNEVILSFPALPEGRWSYSVLVQGDDGSQRILFSGYISVLGVSRAEELASGTPMKNRTLLVAMPGEATTRLRMEWLATTAAQTFATHARQSSEQSHADAETASQAATTATDAASTATERAKEAEGYAGAASASKVEAGNSASAASTSAAEAARDARSANDAKTAVEGIVSGFPQTVSNAEQTISAAKEEAVTAIQGKQADSVLAVGRASQTAQQSVASAQSAAVTAVETAETEAVQAVKTAQATAESSIGGMVQETTDASTAAQTARSEAESAAERAATSATNAASSAAAAQQALAAIPQVDAAGNMTLAGGMTTASAINANGGVNIPVAPSMDTQAARLVDVQRSCLASVLHFHPTTAKASATLGNVQDDLNGVIYSGPGSAGRRISAVSYRVEMHNTYQSLGAVIKITLMRDLWGSTTICLSGSKDISDNADSPMLSTAAIAQLTINDEDNDDAYKIYDHQGFVLSQGILPRTLIGHNIVVDLYVVRWHSRFYFYQGCVWTNRDNYVPGSSYELPLYLGSAPTNTGYYGAINVICAKGCNNHMWGNVPKGILHRIDEFRLPAAGMFFPNLTD